MGVEGFTKALAVELGPFGIRVNTIAPTFIETHITRPFLEDERVRRAIVDKIKLGKLGRLEDVVGAAIFLASDASAMMTGSSRVIDGGWTAD
jgi:NAD(P)-dependent dehydrogenase (short-subunit alcohol dehydrogenase family)